MKSNPDEYRPEYKSEEMDRVKTFLTDVERAALHAAEREVLLGRYHQNLMQTILKSNEPKEAEDEKYRASKLYAQGATAGQVIATTRDGYTWTKLDHDAYLAQSRNMQNSLQAAQQSALMQSQLGGLAQSQQVYGDARLTMPTTAASALGLKTETASEALTGVINKLLGR
jgi:uncharacterized protein YktA (UPF0223 family)